MNIRDCNTTYMTDDIYEITLDFFSQTITKNRNNISPPYNNKSLFGFYDDEISFPIEYLKDGVDEERQNFYELVAIMAWSIYGQWINKLSSNSDLVKALGDIDANEVKRLFIDNLQCEEGISLLEIIDTKIVK